MGRSETLETWGNPYTMNMNEIVYRHVQQSSYSRELANCETYHEIVSQVCQNVTHLEPFIRRREDASTAFCLLFKFWMLQLSIKQISSLLNHENPFVRAIGFLYLRYVCVPADLMEWYSPYLDDSQEVQVRMSSGRTTIGKFIRSLLTEADYYGTRLPPIPIPILRRIEQEIGVPNSSNSRRDGNDGRRDDKSTRSGSMERKDSRHSYDHRRSYKSSHHERLNSSRGDSRERRNYRSDEYREGHRRQKYREDDDRKDHAYDSSRRYRDDNDRFRERSPTRWRII